MRKKQIISKIDNKQQTQIGNNKKQKNTQDLSIDKP